MRRGKLDKDRDVGEGGRNRARAGENGREGRDVVGAENSEGGLRRDALRNNNSWRFSKDEQGLILPESSE